ncbi:hypothetical protein [Natrinema salinisoli]|uniref:hypothetical protein n=1 Tax=Natrinema salinisoli TaxID=2878535 RepID=UPI001CF03DD2|nr:hypothetical protein [Natrinema salinisoli]
MTPELLLTRPFPGTAMPESDYGTLVIIGGGMIGGTLVALRTIQNKYATMDDVFAWEQTVMPYSVRVVDDDWVAKQPSYDREYKTDRPLLDPRSTELYDLHFDFKKSLFGMVVAAPAVAASLYGSATYDDLAFEVAMMFAFLYLFHNSLQVDQRDTERSTGVTTQQ